MKENIMQALNLTWKGMLAVFLVMAVIFLLVMAMNFITRRVQKYRDSRKLPSPELPENTENPSRNIPQ